MNSFFDEQKFGSLSIEIAGYPLYPYKHIFQNNPNYILHRSNV
ncbi:hypothetical protein M085_3585, partial [Bacteroides fragilis str. 3986 N(B)19]